MYTLIRDKRILAILFAVILQIIVASAIRADGIYFPVSDIPEELKTNADAVVRLDEGYFDVLSPGKAKGRFRYVVTILNKNGDHRARFFEYYNKFRKLTDISMKIYSAEGKLLDEIQHKEFSDISIADGFSLYSDYRARVFKPVPTRYPYTIAYEVVTEYNGLMTYPPWYFISGYNVSVQRSRYIVTTGRGLDLRYNQFNLNIEPEVTSNNKSIIYKWEMVNLKPLQEEPYSPPITDFAPHILLGPNDFELDGYAGNMATWKNYGSWISGLNSGRTEIPDKTIVYLHEQMKNCITVSDKVKFIYEYLQNKTRYVSIAIGIGGLQPFPSKVVDEVGYGDCKALSNYMVSLLRAFDIKAHYVLIRAGDDAADICQSFPSAQFNHAIVCVPVKDDTIWLECTDKYTPFGFLGAFTDDRYALLIQEDGGKLVKTPTYPKDSNQFIHRSFVELFPDGNATSNSQLVYKALVFDNVEYIIHEDRETQKRWLYTQKIPNFNIRSFSFASEGDRFPEATLTEELDLPKYATASGNRLFLPLKLMDREIITVPRKIDERRSDIYFKRERIRYDSITYAIPDGFQIEYIPGDCHYESVFGIYDASVIVTGNQILYARRYENNAGTFPKTEYGNLIDFYKKIAKADKAQVVLVRK